MYEERPNETATGSQQEAVKQESQRSVVLVGESTSTVPLILIAEDDEAIAEAVAFAAEEEGYEPLLARDGKEALELAHRRRPALILTDLMMPSMDGIELIAALRADADSYGHYLPPLIVMTAGGLRRAEQVGADAILRKPFTIAELDNLFHRFLCP